jgi:hypothetical protein
MEGSVHIVYNYAYRKLSYPLAASHVQDKPKVFETAELGFFLVYRSKSAYEIFILTLMIHTNPRIVSRPEILASLGNCYESRAVCCGWLLKEYGNDCQRMWESLGGKPQETAYVSWRKLIPGLKVVDRYRLLVSRWERFRGGVEEFMLP